MNKKNKDGNYNIEPIRLSNLKRFEELVKKTNAFETDPQITFEQVMTYLFPKCFFNIKETMRMVGLNNYKDGYAAGLNEGKKSRKK